MNNTDFPDEAAYVIVTITPILLLCLFGLCCRSITNCKQQT